MSNPDCPAALETLLDRGTINLSLLAPVADAAGQVRANVADAAADLNELNQALQGTAELARQGLAQTNSAAENNDSALSAYGDAGARDESHFKQAENLARRNQPGIEQKQSAYGRTAAELHSSGTVRKAKSGTRKVSGEAAEMLHLIEELHQAQQDILTDGQRYKKERIAEGQGMRTSIQLQDAATGLLGRFNAPEGSADQPATAKPADQVRNAADGIRVIPEMLNVVDCNLQSARTLHQQLGEIVNVWPTAPPLVRQQYNELGLVLEQLENPPPARQVAEHLGVLATTQVSLETAAGNATQAKTEQIDPARKLIGSASEHYRAYRRRK